MEAKSLLEEGRRHISEREKSLRHIRELRQLNESAESVTRAAVRGLNMQAAREQVRHRIASLGSVCQSQHDRRPFVTYRLSKPSPTSCQSTARNEHSMPRRAATVMREGHHT